jgi:catechol 2,3-dioxygenase-like lactoylglutathione lyase family enzyme
MFKNDLQNTLVQVLEFDPKPTKKAREGFAVQDGGYFDIAYRCQDNDEAYAKFTGMGYEFPTPPYRYVTSWSNAEVLEAVMYGPDNMPIALMGKTKSTPAFEGTFRNMPDSVLIVDSIEEADKYYVDTLGVSKVFDMVLEAGLVEPIFNLEGNAQIHMTMYMGTDAATPVIEIISFEALDSVSITEKGGVLGDYAGKFATCFEVENLEEAVAKHEANGFGKYGEITEYELAPYGKVRSCVVHGPSKALMELYQIVK